MGSKHKHELTPQELRLYFKNNYIGSALDFTAIYFGYAPASINWENGEPQPDLFLRYKYTVIEALNDTNSKLIALSPNDKAFEVKRDTFFIWAQDKWPQYKSETNTATAAWKTYKSIKPVVHSNSTKAGVFKFIKENMEHLASENLDFYEKKAAAQKSQLKKMVTQKFKNPDGTINRYVREAWELYVHKYTDQL